MLKSSSLCLYSSNLGTRSSRWISCYFLLGPGFWRSYLKLTAVIDTNYGKTTRIPNIPETRTLLKHETDRNENFGNKKHYFKNGNKIFWVVQIFLGQSADGKLTTF